MSVYRKGVAAARSVGIVAARFSILLAIMFCILMLYILVGKLDRPFANVEPGSPAPAVTTRTF